MKNYASNVDYETFQHNQNAECCDKTLQSINLKEVLIT